MCRSFGLLIAPLPLRNGPLLRWPIIARGRAAPRPGARPPPACGEVPDDVPARCRVQHRSRAQAAGERGQLRLVAAGGARRAGALGRAVRGRRRHGRPRPRRGGQPPGGGDYPRALLEQCGARARATLGRGAAGGQRRHLAGSRAHAAAGRHGHHGRLRGRPRQLTRDHSWVAELLALKRLTPAEARHHRMRNVITRCLGGRPDLEVPSYPPEPLLPGDAVVLCTDGLWGTTDDGEIARLVSQHSAQVAADQLVALANDRGGPDNITVIVVRVESPRLGEYDEGTTLDL